MRKILLCIILFSLFFPGLPGYAATNEGYGEDEQALGQFVDSFENLNNISVKFQIERNSTYNAMELNYTPESRTGFFDDFEANNLDKWDVTDGWSTNAAYKYSGVYGARGLGILKKLGVLLDNDYTEDLAISVWWQPKTYRSYFRLLGDNGATSHIYLFHRADLNTFYYYDGGSQVISAGCAENNWYNVYINDVDFVADTYDIVIRDSSMVVKGSIDNAPFHIVGTHLDYISFQAGTAISGQLWIDDVNLTSPTGGYELSGYFTTVDYLGDPLANGSALVALVNTSIPANTQILMQFSNDNATWGDNEGVPLDSHVLSGGFEAIDLRTINYSTAFYYRFNFSTTDSTTTPRIYQNRLITTIGNSTGAGGGPGAVNRPTILIVGGLITIVIAVFIGVKKR